MNDLIKRAMGAPKVNPFSFMALLASVGGVPLMDIQPASQNRAFFAEARAKIDGFAAEHRHSGYGFFELMEDQGFMPRTSDLAEWMDVTAEETIAHVLGTVANDNIRAPRLVPSPPRRPKAA